MKIRGFSIALLVTMIAVFVVLFVRISNDKSGIETTFDKAVESQIELVRANMALLAREILSYADQNELPSSLNELRRMNPHFIVPVDAWGLEIVYEKISADRFRLKSAGPDRKFETPDDIIKEY